MWEIKPREFREWEIMDSEQQSQYEMLQVLLINWNISDYNPNPHASIELCRDAVCLSMLVLLPWWYDGWCAAAAVSSVNVTAELFMSLGSAAAWAEIKINTNHKLNISRFWHKLSPHSAAAAAVFKRIDYPLITTEMKTVVFSLITTGL